MTRPDLPPAGGTATRPAARRWRSAAPPQRGRTANSTRAVRLARLHFPAPPRRSYTRHAHQQQQPRAGADPARRRRQHPRTGGLWLRATLPFAHHCRRHARQEREWLAGAPPARQQHAARAEGAPSAAPAWRRHLQPATVRLGLASVSFHQAGRQQKTAASKLDTARRREDPGGAPPLAKRRRSEAARALAPASPPSEKTTTGERLATSCCPNFSTTRLSKTNRR